MDSKQLVHFSQWRIVKLNVGIQPGSNQAVADGSEPIGAFRMVGSHVVLPAVAVRDEGRNRHDGCLG
jgi:hypothetical protein